MTAKLQLHSSVNQWLLIAIFKRMRRKDYSLWEKHKPFIEQLSKINNSFVFVLELEGQRESSCLYLSDNYCDFFGYDRERLFANGIDFDYLASFIHPNDADIFWMTQRRLIDYLFSLSKNERLNYKHIYEFRMYNTQAKWVRMVSQHQVLEVDSEGEPWLVLGVMDVSPDQTSDTHVKLRLVNFKTGAITPFQLSQKEKDIILTTREKEVLEMIRIGYLSKEISEKLSISIHTVNNHRKNILEKMNVDNAVEAINFARALGLLD